MKSLQMRSSARGLPGTRLHRQRLQVVCAVQAPDVVVDKTFPLRNGKQVQIRVQQSQSGDQVIRMTTDLQGGRLLLHWGVEGGKGYKGGWRLPEGRARPEGTNQYKDRALQSPIKQVDGKGELYINLPGDEASDVLNFVLKDDATNTWYDANGSNFKVSLRASPSTDDGGASRVENLPKELCDKWAYIRWEHAGRPQRSNEASTDEYNQGVLEMKELVMKGRAVDELWRVAEGKWRYADYRNEIIQPLKEGRLQANGNASAPPKQQVKIPEDLVGVQAFLLWEKAGKPGNADFSNDARRELERQVAEGKSLEQLCQQLNFKPQWLNNNGGNGAATAPPPPKAEEKKQEKKDDKGGSVVGSSLSNLRSRNPLDLIKRSEEEAPQLSAGKSKQQLNPMEALVQRFAIDPATKWRRLYSLGNSKSSMLAVVRQADPESPVQFDLLTDNSSEMVMHWGCSPPGSREWKKAGEDIWPPGTTSAGHVSSETPFGACTDEGCNIEFKGSKLPLQSLTFTLPADHKLGAITFVLRSKDNTMWYKDAGGNYFVPLPSKHTPPQKPQSGPDVQDDLSKSIYDAEATSAWTLMHRFNKAADLLNQVNNGDFDSIGRADAYARIYVWLRYSSTRHLTWQRNYNTQPRILSAAQDRLTNTIAGTHRSVKGEAQEWVRAMLSLVGRGGDGQRIRDEILNIMHRNHIKEVKGTWMEEWHQKLHNNTTPDDVPICQAYIAFLEANGNNGVYWRVLSDAGLTRQRLESFDRAIKQEPEFFGDKKDTLIKEFRNYLAILKAVHSGADLQASAAAAGDRTPEPARGYLGYVLSHMGDSQILPFMEAAVEARTELANSVTGNRELLYLDLSLEDEVRRAAERGVGSAGFGAAAFMKPLLQNLALSLGNNEEVCYCLKAWNELPASIRNGGRPSKEEALLAVAVVNRIRRAISETSDAVLARIGDVSAAYGRNFNVDGWAVDLFAEEVVRGGPAFAVSLVISNVEPALRSAAALGAWQVISPNTVTGVVEYVPGLSEVQEKVYAQPTILLADQVTGEEEIPDGVVAVLTPDAPDVLSHVSVRARNMKVLFATCHDEAPLKQIRESSGKRLTVTTTASGSVTWTEAREATASEKQDAAASGKPGSGLKIEVPTWSGKWVVGMDEFSNGVVGAKSKNLAAMRGKLPDWISLPASVTLPFGCFEETLEAPENHSVRDELKKLVLQIAPRNADGSLKAVEVPAAATNGEDGKNENSAAKLLEKCRELALQVTVPKVVREELSKAMQAAGIPLPQDEARWELALKALKGVWASKYNDRAFYSMKKVGLHFDDVRMAVLVQRVVPAHYAFVIHTKNPSNNDEKEVFCELVQGLGESLVSGMVPGSAVAFKAQKTDLENPEVLCYASKSEGMFVPESLIFRSDSNGEDLEGYAGAGLYESITMDKTELRKVDYMEDKLVRDPAHRKAILSKICTVGATIETAMGSAQDIEGVVEVDGKVTVVQTRPQV